MKNVNLLIENGVDIKSSLDIFGDMETYDDTLIDFLGSIPEKLTNIQNFKESMDMANYAILVHSLKSDAKYFGFTKLAEFAYNHEIESKANNVSFVYNNYENLMNEANRIVKLVGTYLGKEVKVKEEKIIQDKDKIILVVDDSDIIRNFIHKILDNNFVVLNATDGNEALKIINSEYQSQIVGMLLDLNMPNLNGFSVLDYFKQNNLFAKIPVSIITGEDSKEVVNKAFTYNIVDVLTKPFNEKSIKNIVEKTLNVEID